MLRNAAEELLALAAAVELGVASLEAVERARGVVDGALNVAAEAPGASWRARSGAGEG